MSNCVFVQAGQCGNQLGFTLLDEIFTHLAPNDEENNHLNTYFRGYRSSNKKVARAVCLDTEPKVINESIHKAEKGGRWQFSNKSVAYRHGGAGNNWALGYSMTSGEYLETALNCIQRELEYCDHSQTLVFMHSVAGGTGSGLGTRITEACQDSFPHTTRLNIAITPYHFGEVIVQHYNTLLCLSKISNASHGVITFENETAKILCQTMRAIERPTMTDINYTIVSNLIPIFLPKVITKSENNYYSYFTGTTTTSGDNNNDPNNNSSNKSPYSTEPTQWSSLLDDVTLLCSHPAYRFLDIKSTPQTSTKGKQFTYDSWFALIKTLTSLQLSGSASESHISRVLKGRNDAASITNNTSYQDNGNNNDTLSDTSSVHSHRGSGGGVSGSPQKENNNNSTHLLRSLCSLITLYGDQAEDSALELSASYNYTQHSGGGRNEGDTPRVATGSVFDRDIFNSNNNNNNRQPNTLRSSQSSVRSSHTNSSTLNTYNTYNSNSSLMRSTASSRQSNVKVSAKQELLFSSDYLITHSDLFPQLLNQPPVSVCHSHVKMNGYARSCSSLSNNQSIIPIIRNARDKAERLYKMQAYTHQYFEHGLEQQDFIEAFHTIGSVINSYMEL